MGVASCNKSTGDMLAACGAEQVKQAAGWTLRKQRQQANGAKSAGKLERLKQASWGYLLAGGAPAAKTVRGGGGGASSKSLASSGDEDEAPRRQPLLAGPPVVLDLQDFADYANFEDGAPTRRQVGRSNCYIWPTALAGAVEAALEAPQVELISRRPLEEREERAKHIRPAQSSPVLHESLIAPGGLPPAARPPPVVQVARDGGGSLSSLAARRESPGGAEAKRARARDGRKLRAGQLQQRLRRLRRGRPPVACDSDSDSCAGERRAAAAKGKVPHHAGDAAARMLHNCQRETTIEPPRGAGNCSPWRAASPGARTPRGELRNCADFDFESNSDSDSDFDGAASIGGRERANLDASDQPAAQPGHSEWSGGGGGGEEVGRSCKNNGRPARPHDFQPAELDASSTLAAAAAVASFRPASAGRQPDGSWPRALPDRVCRDARRASGEQQQQQQAASSSSSKHAAGASHEQPPSMGLAELESAASRLAGGLLGACSSSAGSYKVVQQQQRQKLELLESHRRRQRHCKRPCELAEVDQRAACDTVGNRALAEGKRQQASRAGGGGRQSSSSTRSRSPVALQRQTNARLARHKLKIQQQRQEQLANLAQRERQQFQRASLRLAAAAGRGRQQPAGEQLEIEVLSSSGSSARHSNGARPASGSLNYFKTLLLNALPAALSPPGRRQSRDLPLSEPGASSAARLQAGPRRPSGAHCAISIPGGATLAPPGGSSINNAPARAGPSRDRREPLARSLAQANVVVHRSPIDLAAAVANRASFHGRASGRQASAQRRAATTTTAAAAAATTTTAAATTTSGAFEFQFRHLAGQRASADESGARRNRLMGAPMGERRALDAQSSSSSSAASSTLSLNKPFCKICHLSSSKLGDKLISPCKCSGTLQHIHCGCLLKWLEISNRANERQPMSCELCAHEYTWHKRFNYAQMKLPRCSLKDALLHTTFVLALGLMLFCALAPIFHTTRAADELQLGPRLSVAAAPNLVGDHQQPPMLSGGARRAQFKTPGAQTATASFNGGANGGRLAGDEKFILLCAGLFFVAFFIAIYAQTKARDTLYGLIVKFANLNLTYYITEYDHGQQQQQQQQQQPARRTGKSEQGARQARPAALDDNNRDLSRCPAAGTQAPREGAPLHAGAGEAHAARLPPLAGQHQKPLQHHHHHQKG